MVNKDLLEMVDVKLGCTVRYASFFSWKVRLAIFWRYCILVRCLNVRTNKPYHVWRIHLSWTAPVVATVAYAEFWKGGQKLQKIWEEQRTESEIVPPKHQSDFSSKIRWRAKKSSSLKFSPIFCPKLGMKSKKKGLHSNLVQFFAQTWMQA